MPGFVVEKNYLSIHFGTDEYLIIVEGHGEKQWIHFRHGCTDFVYRMTWCGLVYS
jgi:hypothetical protein